jgi:glycosyltransferase involved in cell wall biosynthesis
LVLPYVDATQSALVAAAYYFRKPVVVTHAGALPEYVEDGVTGAVVEPGHPAALARCLEELLGDPEHLARMGAAGRAWYDTQRAREERALSEMYDRLANGKRVPEPTARLSDRPI